MRVNRTGFIAASLLSARLLSASLISTGLIALAGGSLIASGDAGWAQTAAKPASDTAVATNGAELVATKCFQCHTDSMFRDQRQDAGAWKATIYRMMGRGGLWTQDEIDSMADYLGTVLGPDATPVAVKSK